MVPVPSGGMNAPDARPRRPGQHHPLSFAFNHPGTSSTQPAVRRLAVVMPCYNAGPFLTPAIESILGQSWRDFEFIIVDDGSTDGSLDTARSFASRDSRVRVLVNDRNLGPGGASNRGIAATDAVWIARMDSDDVSHPDCLALQMAATESAPGSSFVTSYLDVIEPSGRLRAGPRGIGHDFDLLPWFLLFYNRVGGNGQVTFSAAAFRSVGGYIEAHRQSEDRSLWPRLLRVGPACLLRQPLFQWRRSPGSITGSLGGGYAPGSLQNGIDEIRLCCGLDVDLPSATALRDFWMRRDDAARDWDHVQRLLLATIDRFSPPRPVHDFRRRARRAVALGWLGLTLRALRRRDRPAARGHIRRAHAAAGPLAASAHATFLLRLAAMLGATDRLQ